MPLMDSCQSSSHGLEGPRLCLPDLGKTENSCSASLCVKCF